MSKILQCYIVDDEPDSRAVIKKYIDLIPFLSLCGESGNAVEGLFEVQRLTPDLLFLDVQMPKINGFEFIRSLTGPKPFIIMITAFSQFAIEGFEHQVLDYLLKPVSFERFLKAISRVKTVEVYIEDQDLSSEPRLKQAIFEAPAKSGDISFSGSVTTGFILVKQGTKLIKVETAEIIYIESMKDYMKIYLKDKTIISHGTLTKMVDLLPSNMFLRVSRSYVINERAIMEIDGNQITTVNGKKIDIGITYREAVQHFLDQYKK